jgi:hypothetical protein
MVEEAPSAPPAHAIVALIRELNEVSKLTIRSARTWKEAFDLFAVMREVAGETTKRPMQRVN